MDASEATSRTARFPLAAIVRLKPSKITPAAMSMNVPACTMRQTSTKPDGFGISAAHMSRP